MTRTTSKTKFNVQKVITPEGSSKPTFVRKGTLVLYDDHPERGCIMTDDYGRLDLFRKEKVGVGGRIIYLVKKAKPTQEAGKKISKQVGTFVLRPDGKGGSLFLDLLDDSFAVFKMKKQESAANEAAVEPGAVAA